MSDPALGLAIAVAIAIHNIPEGMAVSVPIYYSTGDRKKAFVYSFLSGLAEPVGAVAGYLILMPFMGPGCVWSAFRRRGRHHGVHLIGRAFARGPGIRRAPPFHLRPGAGHGHHGAQPAHVRELNLPQLPADFNTHHMQSGNLSATFSIALFGYSPSPSAPNELLICQAALFYP